MMMYELAAQVSSESPHILWLAILGITEHFLQHRCTVKQYVNQVETLRVAAVMGHDKDLSFFQDEYLFVLYRHWNLYESMFHSPQVATRLGIWSEGGRRKLDQLLAKMGFPLHECKQQYSIMNSEIKDLLPGALKQYASDFGLSDITFPSFVKMLDNKLKMSASDCVYAVSALMEVGNVTKAVDGRYSHEQWENNFWNAYDALAEKVQWDLIKDGLKSAVHLQEAVVHEGVDLLLKKIIVRNGPFRYGVLHDSANLDVLVHPQVLTRLALFLLEALKKPGKPSKPLVLCALNRKRNTYLVLGVTPTAPSTRKKRNDFGTSFQQAAKITGSSVEFHNFDSSIIEVLDRDLVRFLELLHSGLLGE